MLTKLPEGYPKGYTLPPAAKLRVAAGGKGAAEYFDRGWCFTESSLCAMTKDYDFVFDLGKLSDEMIRSGMGHEDIRKVCAAEGARPPPRRSAWQCSLSPLPSSLRVLSKVWGAERLPRPPVRIASVTIVTVPYVRNPCRCTCLSSR